MAKLHIGLLFLNNFQSILQMFRMKLDVYFDDDLKDVYGSAAKAKGKLQKVMTYVQEIYEERDTLQTIIKMKINVQHKSGQRWAGPMA